MIYAVVRIYDNKEDETLDCLVYSKQSSNKDVMKEYAREIAKKYQSCKIYLVSREKARGMKNKCEEINKQRENAKLARLDKNLNEIYLKNLAKTLDRR